MHGELRRLRPRLGRRDRRQGRTDSRVRINSDLLGLSRADGHCGHCGRLSLTRRGAAVLAAWTREVLAPVGSIERVLVPLDLELTV